MAATAELLLLSLFLYYVGAFPLLEECEFIDLTYSLNNDTLHWPTAQPFVHTTAFKGISEQGYFYSSFNYKGAEHVGTHLDAPFHFAEQGLSTEQIPLKQLIGEGCVIDVSSAVGPNTDYQIPVEEVTKWEREHGRSVDGCIVIFRTGWASRWPDPNLYLGTDTKEVEKLRFPGIHPDVAEWIVTNRKGVKAVGLDTASLDYGRTTDFRTHRILLNRNIPGLENLMNVDKLPAVGSTVIVLPMKIEGGSGGPVRAVAFGTKGASVNCLRGAASTIATINWVLLPLLSLFAVTYVETYQYIRDH